MNKVHSQSHVEIQQLVIITTHLFSIILLIHTFVLYNVQHDDTTTFRLLEGFLLSICNPFLPQHGSNRQESSGK